MHIIISEEFQETPTPAGIGESTAVHLQVLWQHAPHLCRGTFLDSKP